MTQHSRRSFLGLFSAISAAVAAGVRLPDAPAKAAEMAPVEDLSDGFDEFDCSAVSEDELMVLEASKPIEPPSPPEELSRIWSTIVSAGELDAAVRAAIKDCIVTEWETTSSMVGGLVTTTVRYRYAPGVKCHFSDKRPAIEASHICGVSVHVEESTLTAGKDGGGMGLVGRVDSSKSVTYGREGAVKSENRQNYTLAEYGGSRMCLWPSGPKEYELIVEYVG
jgi:hypothetical protein